MSSSEVSSTGPVRRLALATLLSNATLRMPPLAGRLPERPAVRPAAGVALRWRLGAPAGALPP
eukprot:3828407-Pyramimonas_sp.AAC.1